MRTIAVLVVDFLAWVVGSAIDAGCELFDLDDE
jgi:hypothetical protein